MLTVLYICTDIDFAGSSKSLYNMIEALHGKVHPIVLLSAKGEVYDYFTKHGIQCIVKPFFYLWEKPKRLKTILHHPSKSLYYQNWKIDRECVKYVKHVLDKIKVDIVHTNTTIVTIGINLSKALQAKHVWHVREYLDLDHGIKVFRGQKRLRRLINDANARIVITKSVNQHWNLKNDFTFVFPNAVRHTNEAIYNETKEKYFLFASASLTENKGASFAIRSFAKSKLAAKGYRLTMLGHCSAEYKQFLNELIDSYAIQDSIEFLGFKSNVEEFYSNASGYLMTSRCEAMGRVTIDAMFFGCPIIARNTGGTADIIHDGYNGLLFSTEEECASLMNRVVNDEVNISLMITNAQREAIEKYSVEKYRNEILKVYNAIC